MQEIAVQQDARDALREWRHGWCRDLVQSDGFLKRTIERLLPNGHAVLEDELCKLSTRLGPSLDFLVRRNNQDANLPEVLSSDDFGAALEQVEHHPDYAAIGEVFWGSGVLARLAEPGHEIEAGAVAYLLDHHGEAGHACPVACTAGAIKLIRELGTEAQRQRYLPGLLETDYGRRLHAAQFVTEVQGGSDVGANGCVATPDRDRPGWYRIRGEKWFCSVADAGLFVVSARLEQAPQGTRGLGLFLVPRELDGAPNGFRLRRLKTKLGTRSMPTGEIDFDGALGEPIGDLDRGFRNLVAIVLDTSRVHNALAACGLMRRAELEARHFAACRTAFGQAIAGFGAVREILTRMRVRRMAAVATTFRVLAMTDEIERSAADETELRAARRISVMLNKYWTAVAATDSARDGIEILGGNGTIEDFSVMPRLYRDAIVVESWEGTHNTLCAQVFRDFQARRLHEPFFACLEREAEALTEHVGARETGVQLVSVARDAVQRVATFDGDQGALLRAAVDRMCRAVDWVALATQLTWDLDQGRDSRVADALAWYRLRIVENRTPLEDPALVELEDRLA